MSKGRFIITSIASAVSGAVIGLLFAPEKGSRMRKRIAERSDEALKELKRDLELVRHDINKRTGKTKNKINNLNKEARTKKDDVVKKAKKMTSYEEWTKEELYSRAKELEIENYSTMNKSELITALQNH